MFNLQAHQGIPPRWYIISGVSPRSGTQRCKEHNI
jgi:hypothetical protein